MTHKKNIGYLSGAPLVSTKPFTKLGGPRSHVLGVISGYKNHGYQVIPFIVGDFLPRIFLKQSSRKPQQSNNLKLFLKDITRLLISSIASSIAWYKLKNETDLVYERLASLQALGKRFKKKNKIWILETNAPLFYEAKFDRQSLFLKKLAKKIEINAYRQCDLIVCVNEVTKNIIAKEAGINPNKVVIIPNGVDVSLFNSSNITSKRISSNFTIGFVGLIENWQNLDLLLKAIKELHNENLELFLVIVGDGPEKDRLEEKTKELEISHLVHFSGYVERKHIPNYISGFDLGYSGQKKMAIGDMYHSPLKIYEYSSMAIPILASNYTDAKVITSNGEYGFLFKSDDIESLKATIKKAYFSRDTLPTMGETVRKKILEQHSWKSRVEDIISATNKIKNLQKDEKQLN